MKATILLAEDEQAMREVLTDYFTACLLYTSRCV